MCAGRNGHGREHGHVVAVIGGDVARLDGHFDVGYGYAIHADGIGRCVAFHYAWVATDADRGGVFGRWAGFVTDGGGDAALCRIHRHRFEPAKAWVADADDEVFVSFGVGVIHGVNAEADLGGVRRDGDLCGAFNNVAALSTGVAVADVDGHVLCRCFVDADRVGGWRFAFVYRGVACDAHQYRVFCTRCRFVGNGSDAGAVRNDGIAWVAQYHVERLAAFG